MVEFPPIFGHNRFNLFHILVAKEFLTGCLGLIGTLVPTIIAQLKLFKVSRSNNAALHRFVPCPSHEPAQVRHGIALGQRNKPSIWCVSRMAHVRMHICLGSVRDKPRRVAAPLDDTLLSQGVPPDPMAWVPLRQRPRNLLLLLVYI